jgi:pimeloyl-ACP methyl ester carboxylesterase
MYAARHPDQVTHLLLWCSYARATHFFDGPEARALRSLVDTDWRMFAQTVAHSREGWSQGAAAGNFVRLVQEAVTPQAQAEFMDTMRLADVSGLLPSVQAPTLVLHRQDSSQLPQAAARELAAGIPDARLVLFEGAELAPYLGNSEEVLATMFEFLGVPNALPSNTTTGPILHSGMTAILFADIAESTALTERLGDAAFRTKARELDGALRGGDS